MMKNLNKTVIILLIPTIFVSCKTKERTIYVPEVHTEYKNTVKYDSVYIKDSIFLQQKGDTVFLKKFKYQTKYAYLHDTINRIDTTTLIKKVVEYKKVNELTKWQKIRLEVFNYLIIALFTILIFIFRKQIWSLIKLIVKI